MCCFYSEFDQLTSCLTRLQANSQLKPLLNNSDSLVALTSLISQSHFQQLLNIHNTIQSVQCFQCPPIALCNDSRELAAQVLYYSSVFFFSVFVCPWVFFFAKQRFVDNCGVTLYPAFVHKSPGK